MICFETCLKCLGLCFEICWKFDISNISLNISAWNNWVVLKRTDSSPEKD